MDAHATSRQYKHWEENRMIMTGALKFRPKMAPCGAARRSTATIAPMCGICPRVPAWPGAGPNKPSPCTGVRV